MLTINEFLLPEGHKNRPGFPMDPQGVIYHATSNYNKGAGDEMHTKYLLYTAKNKSWHVTVDYDSSTKHIPFNENAWASGDGVDGHYNRNWIQVEIACDRVNPGEPLDQKTYDNAVDVLAQIVKEFNFGPHQLRPHEVVYGKNCPQTTLFDREKFEGEIFNLVKQRTEKPKYEIMDQVPVNVYGQDMTGILVRVDGLDKTFVEVRQYSELHGDFVEWRSDERKVYIHSN